MNPLTMIEMAGRIALEAPQLTQDATNLITDASAAIAKLSTDFAKLISDFNGIKASAAPAAPQAGDVAK